MRYRVVIQPPAAEDLDQAYRWIADRSPDGAARWLDGALRAIQKLRSFPRRCQLAPENDAFAEEIRQLLYGDYRILFTIDGSQVRVLHIRHGARRYLDPDEVPEEGE
jgi:plasmid stabilization system protein ParE